MGKFTDLHLLMMANSWTFEVRFSKLILIKLRRKIISSALCMRNLLLAAAALPLFHHIFQLLNRLVLLQSHLVGVDLVHTGHALCSIRASHSYGSDG
jgi:hypothetical protein